jgi:hypothetical protein
MSMMVRIMQIAQFAKWDAIHSCQIYVPCQRAIPHLVMAVAAIIKLVQVVIVYIEVEIILMLAEATFCLKMAVALAWLVYILNLLIVANSHTHDAIGTRAATSFYHASALRKP